MVIHSKTNGQALLFLLYIVEKKTIIKNKTKQKKSKTKNKKSLPLVSLGQNHQNRLQLSGMEEGWKLVFQEHGFSEIWEIA